MKNYRRADLITIYQSQIERFHDTRSLQWKFNVSAWTLLAAAIYFKATSNACIPIWAICLSSTIAILGHLTFLILTQQSLNASKSISQGILEHLNEYNKTADIKIDIHELGEKRKWEVKDTLWVLLQIAFSGFLLVIFIWTKVD